MRLSSDERLFGVLDYTIGGLINELTSPTDLLTETPVFAVAPAQGAAYTPGGISFVYRSPLSLQARTLERSIFGNVTAHIDDATEVTGGLRYIHFKNFRNLTGADNYHPLIYSATIEHRFSEEVMLYATTGSSWRVGSGTNSVILGVVGNLAYSGPALAATLIATPEKSKPYEIGFKTDLFAKRLRFNVDYYHQDFKNYIFSSPMVLFLADNGGMPPAYTPTVTPSGLSVGVPVTVNGVEAEVDYRPTRDFNINATASYSLGKIRNGRVVHGGICQTVSRLGAPSTGGLVNCATVAASRV